MAKTSPLATFILPLPCIARESRAGAAVKLINAVRRGRRRLIKFVRRDVFREIGIDPKTYFGRANIRFDIRDANFVLGEVVSESSGANAFVARDAEIFVSGRAVCEMHFRGRTVHQLAANTGAIERDILVTLQAFMLSIFPANG